MAWVSAIFHCSLIAWTLDSCYSCSYVLCIYTHLQPKSIPVTHRSPTTEPRPTELQIDAPAQHPETRGNERDLDKTIRRSQTQKSLPSLTPLIIITTRDVQEHKHNPSAAPYCKLHHHSSVSWAYFSVGFQDLKEAGLPLPG